MSMFDSAYAPIKCPACGDERERELQFEISIGRAYSPQMQEVRVGGKLENFPPIKLVEGDGYVTFGDCCGFNSFSEDYGKHSAVIAIERGVLTGVIYPRPKGHKWAPLPRGRLRARRDAAAKEVFERAYREWKSKQPTPKAGEGMKRIGFAMAYPLLRRLDYAGIGRGLFFIGERTENYERVSLRQPWKRRPDRRLF